jgi:nucleotidyltransferase/DNA polymerase involved in DNA repair
MPTPIAQIKHRIKPSPSPATGILALDQHLLDPTTAPHGPGSLTGFGRSSVAVLWIADVPSWAAERLDPKLEGLPVVVVNGRHVVGANTLARAFGLRVGDAIDRARGLIPNVEFVQFDASNVQAAWDMTITGACSITPWLEPVKPGLAILGGLSAIEAEALALECHARVGLSGSRGTALLTALAARENTARIEHDQTRFLEGVPVYLLRGAGIPDWIVERLMLVGLSTLGQIKAQVTPKQLAAQFPEFASRLWSLANGLETSPIAVFKAPIEISTSYEFEIPALEPHEWMPVLEHLLTRAISQLGERLAGNITVTVRTVLGANRDRRILKEFSRDYKNIRPVAAQALHGALQPNLEVLAITVTLGDLLPLKSFQESLFAILERAPVRAAIRKVHARFPEGIGRFVIHRPKAYLPERRFGFVPLSGEEPSKPTRKTASARVSGKSQ